MMKEEAIKAIDISRLNKFFEFFYSIIDAALDEGFNYERLVWTFNPEHIADPIYLPQAWLRKEALVLQLFASKMHTLVIGPPGIGKTTITEFLNRIHFAFDRATMVGGESGAVTTAAGLREKVIRLADLIKREFDLVTDNVDIRNLPKAILHLEEFLKAPKGLRDVLKPIMNDFLLIVSQSQRSDRAGRWLAPINIYADSNPPMQDDWIGPDFQSKKEQLKEFATEAAYIRRFTVVMALDRYNIKQNIVIRKFKEYIKVNPHPALESGEFYKKYEDFVRKHRRIKVKYTPAPIWVHEFIAGLEDLQDRGRVLLPIVYSDFIDNIYAVAEAFARINEHKEIEEEDWAKAVNFYARIFETIANVEKTDKRSLYERAIELGKRREEEVKEMIERIEEKYNLT